MRRILLVMLLILGGAALAAETVPLPRERPASLPSSAAPDTGSSVPLPRERPEPASTSSSSAEPSAPAPEMPAAAIVAEPKIYQTACPAVIAGKATAKPLPPIHEGQCGLQSPLSLEAVSANGRSIPLNAPVVTDCGMASALPDWAADVDSYLAAHDKTRIKTINVGTGYDCRNVDHAAVGSLSFHAFADAVDVTGFSLEDGRTISIAPGFNGTPAEGHDILHFARDAACTRFSTVLSPDADAFHQDNMHLDLACHGKSCTARLCQ